MADKEPLVSVVILNWNGIEDTKVCLDYVRKLDYTNYEIIVVDNGSNAEQKEYLSKLNDIVYIDNPVNRGFAGGQSDGYKHAKGKYILLLNNDAVIKSDYLRRALPLFKDPGVAVVGGRSYFWNEQEKLFDESNGFYSYMEVDTSTAETTLLREDFGIVQEVNTVSGSSVIVSRSAIEKVGYLHETFFAYYEETDLFARIKRAGYKVLYSPELHIWHRNGASSGAQGGSSFFFYHIFRNRFMYVLRNFESPYIKTFLKNYYSLGFSSVLQIFHGPVQRRLGTAYGKAMLTTAKMLPQLIRERQTLSSQLQNNYCQQMLQEQTRVSIVVDATLLSPMELTKHILELCDPNPYHEYIYVTTHKSVSTITMSVPSNVRFVEDCGYFNTHPINLGVLAARMEWIFICGAGSSFSVDNLCNTIAANSTKVSVIPNKSNELGSLAFSKTYFQKMGGFQTDSKNLEPNIDFTIKYAGYEGVLLNEAVVDLTPSETETISKLSSYNNRIFTQNNVRFNRLLSKYYRLQQFTSLFIWLFNSNIPIRLKLGRIKNLLLFAVTFRKDLLATEIRHIRNENAKYDKRGNFVELLSSQEKLLKIATKTANSDPYNIPIFIICFERLNDLKKQVKKLEGLGFKKIIFIDNDSSYKPLLDYYRHTPYQVLRLYRNVGHTAPWTLDIIRVLVPNDYYIVTDPDVIPVDNFPIDGIKQLIKLHDNFPAYKKVGLGLKIDDLPDHFPLKSDVVAWESQFWNTEITKNVYEAGVDTTFALYKPFTYTYTLHPSLRTGEPYVARHMPWYINPAKATEEESYYRFRANHSITSWNVEELPERYKKEMNND